MSIEVHSVPPSVATSTEVPVALRFRPARVSFRTNDLHADGESLQKLGASLAAALQVPTLFARILLSRNISTVEQAKAFLSPTLRDHLPDPCSILNIEAAADLILDTIEQKKPITVYCDFDVDGLSAGAQVVLFLAQLGAQATVYTPNRFTEGYGLVESAIEKIAQSGAALLVTLDCGITSHRELALARRRGMKTVVIDHHQPQELPNADVVVDPAQPGCPFQHHSLAAAGLALMLLIVLRQKARERFAEQISKGVIALPDPKDFLDLACLGTICDMVPLVGLNRVIAHRGVEALKQTARPGLIALKRAAGISDHRLSAGQVSFGIGPRINAAGRLSDASEIIELLTTTSEARAAAIASSIDKLNTKRRGIEKDVLSSCLRMIKKDAVLSASPALTIFDERFHLGVIGIVAQRLVEQFHRPAAVMAPGEALVRGKLVPVIKGSVRSVRGFNVAEVLATLHDLLLTGGGHEAAGGFSLLPEKLSAFQTAFSNAAGSLLTAEHLERQLLADAEASLAEVDFELVQAMAKLGPFGMGNPTPVIVSHNLTIESVYSVGEEHIKLRVSDGAAVANAVAWRFRGHPLMKKGERVSLAYNPEINTYQGVSSVQLNVKEIWV